MSFSSPPDHHRGAALCGVIMPAACADGRTGVPAHEASDPTTVYSVSAPEDGFAGQAVDVAGHWVAVSGGPLADSARYRTYDVLLHPHELPPPSSGENATTVVKGNHDDNPCPSGRWRAPAIYVSPDSSRLAVASSAQLVRRTPELAAGPLPGPDTCFAATMSFSADGTCLAAACRGGTLRVWPLGDATTSPVDTPLPEGLSTFDTYGAASLAHLRGNTWVLALSGDEAARV